MQLPSHGANPHRLYKKMNIVPTRKIIDFSENINPLGLPKQIQEAWPTLIEKVSAYPDPNGDPFYTKIAEFHEVSNENVFIGNGAAEIFALLANRYRGKTAIVLHPTFSEYEASLRAKEATIERVISSELTGFTLPMKEIQQKMVHADVLYLCTPNNPTGILPSKEVLKQLIEHGKKVNCDIVLDEAFIDFVDEKSSFIPKVERNDHLIVVRSMTKMYAIAGIRLGYIVAHPSVIHDIRMEAPHWNVSSIAAEIGALCLQEKAFVEETKKQSRIAREKMTAFLLNHQCSVTDSVANYMAFKLKNPEKTAQLYEDFLRRGIVLRHSENFIGMDGSWLRIGMKSEEHMSQLREEFERWFVEN